MCALILTATNTPSLSSYFIIANKTSIITGINSVLKEYASMEFTGASHSYTEVMNTVLKEKPSLVFLDIDTFTKRPFDFISELNQYMDTPPFFIAISSNKDHAYDAMKYDFIDYLLHPLEELDIRKAVLKFQKKHTVKKKSNLCLKSYKDYQYLDTNDILFLKADNNATEFHINDGKVTNAFKTLKTFEDKLPRNFLRIHKSYVVNTDYISRINYSKHTLTVKGETLSCIPFTKTYLDNIELIKELLTETLVA